jgi:hypothetical protein
MPGRWDGVAGDSRSRGESPCSPSRACSAGIVQALPGLPVCSLTAAPWGHPVAAVAAHGPSGEQAPACFPMALPFSRRLTGVPEPPSMHLRASPGGIFLADHSPPVPLRGRRRKGVPVSAERLTRAAHMGRQYARVRARARGLAATWPQRGSLCRREPLKGSPWSLCPWSAWAALTGPHMPAERTSLCRATIRPHRPSYLSPSGDGPVRSAHGGAVRRWPRKGEDRTTTVRPSW